MPRRADPDPALPPLALLEQAQAAGMTVDQVRQRVRSGSWVRVARGAYLPRGEHEYEDADEHARARIEHIYRSVAAASRNPGAVVTDASAAVAHGLPLLRLPTNVQLAVPPGRWSGTRSGIDFRVRSLEDDEIHQGRVPVASALRSWIDVTRCGSLAESLTIGDSGLRHGILPSDMHTMDLERWRDQRGCRRLRAALPLLDGARETPLESTSFAYFVTHRLPLPSLQVEIRSRASAFIARVDFLWVDERLVGEADGMVKYDSREALFAEKRREDAIRGEGYRVVRWGATDLQSPALAARLRGFLR